MPVFAMKWKSCPKTAPVVRNFTKVERYSRTIVEVSAVRRLRDANARPDRSGARTPSTLTQNLEIGGGDGNRDPQPPA
jgi:hypothetical protein